MLAVAPKATPRAWPLFWCASRLCQHRWMRHQRLEVDGRAGRLAEVRARSAEAGNARERVLHGLGGVEHLEIAAEAPRHLQAERHAVLVTAAGKRDGGVGHQRDEIGERQPMVIIPERL